MAGGGRSQRLNPPRVPKFSGWISKLVVWILESFLGSWILEIVWKQNGLSKALRRTHIEEECTFSPIWPHPEIDKSTINVESLNACSRAAVSAHTIPGFKAIRDLEKGSKLKRYWEIADYKQNYDSHLVTPNDVAKAILNALDSAKSQSPPQLFLAFQDREDLLEQARQSSRRHQMEEPLSPLDGVPFAVTDAIDALPYPTSSGTSYLANDRRVQGDAPSVSALKECGAILIGKALLHELGIGMTGANPKNGTSRNPWNTDHLCGGSSSGIAALVASGICPFALGIDGGGSVRVPAALCGVVGLKPTVGRTSYKNCPENAESIMSIGVVATSVGDALIVSTVISNVGMQSLDRRPPPTSIYRNLCSSIVPSNNPSEKPLKGLKVGVYMDWIEQSHPQILDRFLTAVRHLAALGCQVVDVEIQDLEAIRVAQMASVGCEIAQACKIAYSSSSKRKQMNLETRFVLANAYNFTATDFIQAQKIRTKLMRNLKHIFEKVSLLAMPTVGIPAPKFSAGEEIDMNLSMELMRYTIPVNMSGLPAISLPIGLQNLGLPVGIQLVGRPWQEFKLLQAALVLEAMQKSAFTLLPDCYDILNSL